ncbi:hypothetical protein [Anaeromyxobacter terrae]|uniref:hypothetical protein n=1 Tax=Anaeromyxobacter terrae TaxID=2925406 RepID=UPI001F55B849|nr:hypothetical protein [Anaeromyxobacter sp. SG22]
MRSLALALFALAAAPAVARDVNPDRSPSIGVKCGVIPPILTAPELLVRIGSGLAFGLFGIYTTIDGEAQTLVAPEVLLELREGRRSTPYLEAAYLLYSETSKGGGADKMDYFALTAGYEWKWSSVELQLGGGIQFLTREEKAPCESQPGEWFGGCGLDLETPSVLPAIDLALRYRFW